MANFEVPEQDLALYRHAQELTGDTLPATIATALRRLVTIEEARQQGYAEIVVHVGPDRSERRFAGLLVAEMEQSGEREVTYRVYRTPDGRFVVHQERSEAHVNTGPNAARWSTGWRAWIGDWSAHQSWVTVAPDATLQIADDLDDLRTIIPLRLYDLVLDAAHQPAAERLDV